ncbi:asparaginase [Amycolatopsis sp. FDAARGOS 1241]|uniref:asparaginase n=1 Tax=Amycolatopsis sp. FDAARGOS 1241 TaxID=2778070 RepID=UPI00194E86B5|nr:asparaginase [Amycolatopsis sp. FDAARGOS 1241]QRP44509.1 asparaginase [Amycolatopsis sp. FDAARGOS 1241]
MTRALVAVAALGGTISMAPDRSIEDGVVPRLTAEDLLGDLGAHLPMDVTAATLAGISSASMDYATLLRTRAWGLEQVAAGAAGLVVVQGTDTLEETAWFFELTWPHDVPVVVTGAMRNPSLPSADGPANLLAALTVAASPRSRGRGALVAFNDDVHTARWVRKAHASHVEAFSSNPAGPLGLVAEGSVHYFHPAGSRAAAVPVDNADFAGLVPLLEAGIADSGELLSLVLDAGARGVVVAAGGVGHVSTGTADVIATADVPIVVATRTGAGTTFRGTYGFHGSESSLIKVGATMAGWLDPRKSRVLLQVLLATGASREAIEAEFRLRGDLD